MQKASRVQSSLLMFGVGVGVGVGLMVIVYRDAIWLLSMQDETALSWGFLSKR